MELDMKITDVEVIKLRVPGWDASTFDGSYDDVVIRVHTDAGISGIAEVDSVPEVIRAIIEAPSSHTGSMGLKDCILGQDPLDIAGLWQRMYHGTRYVGRRGCVIHAISGIDIALWDIKGKVEGKPVADLLGSSRRKRVKAYGTVYPVGSTVDEVRSNIDRGLKLGLRAIKLAASEFWKDDVDLTARLIEAARNHVGNEIALIIDAATAWSRAEDGLPLMDVFAANKITWLEAPLELDDVEGHARFQGWGIPIGVGDLGLTTHFEYADVFERGKCDIAQPDISVVGGYSELLRVAELVRQRGKRIVPHGYKTNLLIATNLQFLAQHSSEEMCEYSTSESPLRWELTRERFPIDADGMVAVPDLPGLGVSLDPVAIETYRVK
jgi:L-alanine-DL-glutamate epimerase-like enolase superfamily enzyme